MEVLASTMSPEAVTNQNHQTVQTEKPSEAFQTAFKSAYTSGTESMDTIFAEAASAYGVSEKLLKAVAKAESNFNPNAVSKAGAIGVMQLMPATARSLGVTNPYDARQNIMGGAKYLRENLDRFNGNVDLALAAYNAGPNSVQKYGGIPPYTETQNYVKTVNSYLNGVPITTGKTVQKSALSSMYGASSALLSSSSGSSSASFLSGLYGGSSSSLLSGLYGGGLYGSSGTSVLSSLLGAATTDESGDTISLDKESFVNLIEILRMQMLMNASREVGSISL